MNNLIFKGNSILIPTLLRKDILNKIQYSDMGFRKCLLLAKEQVFWPTMMANELQQMIESCHLCQKYTNSQAFEPLQNYVILSLLWNKTGCDVFKYKSTIYLLMVNYYSKFVELEKLNSTTSKSVILNMKSIFARHGIPLTIVSDGVLQFTSEEFETSATSWDFNHVLSFPRYPQSKPNVKYKPANKSLKKLLKITKAYI